MHFRAPEWVNCKSGQKIVTNFHFYWFSATLKNCNWPILCIQFNTLIVTPLKIIHCRCIHCLAMLGARFIALALIGLQSIFPAEAGNELRVEVGVSVKGKYFKPVSFIFWECINIFGGCANKFLLKVRWNNTGQESKDHEAFRNLNTDCKEKCVCNRNNNVNALPNL